MYTICPSCVVGCTSMLQICFDKNYNLATNNSKGQANNNVSDLWAIVKTTDVKVTLNRDILRLYSK